MWVIGDVEDAASAYWGGATGLSIVCWAGTLEGPAIAVYSGRAFSGSTSCAVLLDGSADFSILSNDSGWIECCWRATQIADREADWNFM